jgi:Type I restriction enzyme R protein N terminus (HSDR_N)
MEKLNLPAFEYTVKESDGRIWIYDVLRKKYLMLTPEEWVRQHFLHYLLNHVQYPKSLIKVEGGLKFNRLQKRSDIVVFDRKGNPWMIVECKAPDLPINESTLRQASVYNVTLKAKYLVMTNGMKTFCCHLDGEDGNGVMLKDLPSFE